MTVSADPALTLVARHFTAAHPASLGRAAAAVAAGPAGRERLTSMAPILGLRLALGWSQADLGAAMGMTRSGIARAEQAGFVRASTAARYLGAFRDAAARGRRAAS